METLYQHYYAVKFQINKKLSKSELNYLKKPLFKMQKENIGIIVASINKLPDDMLFYREIYCPFVGERIIPLSLFQKKVQKSELIYIWNELIQKFGEYIKFSVIEHGSFKKNTLDFLSYYKFKTIVPIN